MPGSKTGILNERQRMFAYLARVYNHVRNDRHIQRYIIVGMSVYIFELLVIKVSISKAGASPLRAVTYSYCSGLVVSFLLQKIITFKDRRMHHRILLPQLLAFSCLVIFNLGFTLVCTKLLAPLLSPVFTRTIALGLSTFWNFYLYKMKIFNYSQTQNEPPEKKGTQ